MRHTQRGKVKFDGKARAAGPHGQSVGVLGSASLAAILLPNRNNFCVAPGSAEVLLLPCSTALSLPISLWNMDHELVWEPSTDKETAYYEKLFRVVDRDKSGTVDGKEAVQFLAHSGLSKSQLKVHPMASLNNTPARYVCLRYMYASSP